MTDYSTIDFDSLLALAGDDEVVTHSYVRDIPLTSGKTLALITLDNGRDHTRPNTLGAATLLEDPRRLVRVQGDAGDQVRVLLGGLDRPDRTRQVAADLDDPGDADGRGQLDRLGRAQPGTVLAVGDVQMAVRVDHAHRQRVGQRRPGPVPRPAVLPDRGPFPGRAVDLHTISSHTPQVTDPLSRRRP